MKKISEVTKKWRKKNNGGFTTVELIVSIVLILILSSGLILGIMKWMEWSDFKRQNEYAKTLFIAAQNQITEYSSGGQLEAFEKETSDSTILANEYQIQYPLVDPQGRAYSLDSIWPEAYGAGGLGSSMPELLRGEIRSITGTPADYQAYQNGTASDEINALYDLFVQYLYDMSLLANGVVCVEFAPADGQIFAVLYSDENTGFTYTGNGSRGSVVNICSRTAKERKKSMVGFYGVDSLYKSSDDVERPVLTEVHLNNEDMLTLSFRVDKARSATQALEYQVDIMDKDSENARVLTLGFSGKDLKNENYKEPVECDVFCYDSYGNLLWENLRSENNGYKLWAWIDLNEQATVRVVLDAADLAATSELYFDSLDAVSAAEARESLRETFSFRRFGIRAENIYCEVQGSHKDNLYKATQLASSNTEHTLFGGYKKEVIEEEEVLIYSIRNMRHLYNMRYLEDKSYSLIVPEGMSEADAKIDVNGLFEVDRIIYEITEDLDWEAFQKAELDTEAIHIAGSLFDNGSPVEEKMPFPSIRYLNARSVLRSAVDDKETEIDRKIISGLKITAEGNSKVYRTNTESGEQEVKSAGLFLLNYGEIENLVIKQIEVDAEEHVGAFCGKSFGTLKNLTVEHGEEIDSVIRGVKNAGGIAGSVWPAKESDASESVYENLVNYAVVSGPVQEPDEQKEDFDITVVGEEASAEDEGEVQTENYGGIFGYIRNDHEKSNDGDAATTYTIRVKNCSNFGLVSAVGTAKEPEDFYNPGETRGLGGIAGKTEGSSEADSIVLEGCVSTQLDENMEALLASGSQAVQEKEEYLSLKMKGFMSGGIVGICRDTELLKCNTERKDGTAGFVYGNSYVGGIVGYLENAEGAGSILEGSSNGNASDAEGNASHVFGKKYAGGIIGYNPGAGVISNWKNTGSVYAQEGYAGSIAGYNAGEICASDVILISADVSGGDFLGGLVGYNDKDASISGYGVSGGSICGAGSYVGGLIGLNASEALFGKAGEQAQEWISKPNLVTGRFCTGGLVGGNIVSTNTDLSLTLGDGNPLGEIAAQWKEESGAVRNGAIAGGYIGYNRLVDESVSGADIIKLAEKCAEKLSETVMLGEIADPQELLKKAFEADILLKDASDEAGAKSRLYIKKADAAKDSSSDSSDDHHTFAQVSAGIHVGGVVGYNDPETALVVEDVTNQIPVKAYEAVYNPMENPAAISNDEMLEGTGSERPDYQGQAFRYSYAGGIVGKVTKNTVISRCGNESSSLVESQGSYHGGICEINEGIIKECAVPLFDMTGMDYVGGIAGLNKSGAVIENCIWNEDSLVRGENYVGGAASENFGKIVFEGKAAVQALGDVGFAGGITGYAYPESVLEITGALDVQVQTAGSFAGGAAGFHEGTIVRSLDKGETELVIEGQIIAKSYAGGFSGINKGGMQDDFTQDSSDDVFVLEGIRNKASVEVLEGMAGGIAGVGTTDIRNCVNEGEILTRNSGNAGGIIAENAMTISKCENKGNVTAVSCAGGIAGSNSGIIRECLISGDAVKIRGVVNEENAYACVGGIAGTNMGIVSDIRFETVVSGEESGFEADKQQDYDESSVSVENQRGYTGGIVGYNRRGAVVEKAVTGKNWVVYASDKENPYYVGGIIGYQESEKGLTDCRNWAQVRSESDTVGGIIGCFEPFVNSFCTLERCVNYGLVSGKANAGGIVGMWKYSAGNIRNCINFGSISVDTEAVGGIVGAYGSLASKTGSVSIEACENHGTIGGTGNIVNAGGIAGASHAGDGIRLKVMDCVNTGMIAPGALNGGILGITDSILENTLVQHCINYGYAYGEEPNALGGIVPIGLDQPVIIRNCLGVAMVSAPIAPVAQKEDGSIYSPATDEPETKNYYLSTDLAETAEKKYGIPVRTDLLDNSTYRLIAGAEESSRITVGIPGFTMDPEREFVFENQMYSENLKVTGAESDHIRYRVFKADNKYFDMSLVTDISKDFVPAAPEAAVGQKMGNAYILEWPEVEKASWYEYKIVRLGENDEVLEEVSGTTVNNELAVFVELVNGKQVYEIQVFVNTVANIVQHDGSFKEIRSGVSEISKEVVVAELPEPECHWEFMAGEDGTLGYRLVLDNRSVYEDFYEKLYPEYTAEQIIELLAKTEIILESQEVHSFTVLEGASDKANEPWSHSGGRETVYLLYADAESLFDPSLKIQGTIFVPSNAEYQQSTEFYPLVHGIQDLEAGFVSDGAGMAYRMKLRSKGRYAWNVRAELIGREAELNGAPVVLTSEELNVTGEVSAAEMLLTGLQADILEKYPELIIRVYPTVVSNVKLGKALNISSWIMDGSQGLTAQQLAAMYVTAEQELRSEAGEGANPLLKDGGLCAGYVLEKCQDGTYRVFYNELLKANAGMEYAEITDYGIRVRNLVFRYDCRNSYDYQPVPVISMDYQEGLVENTDILEVKWDQPSEEGQTNSNFKLGEAYEYTLTGNEGDLISTEDDSEVILETGEYVTSDLLPNVLSWTVLPQWDYKEYRVRITHKGLSNENGVLLLLPGTAEASHSVRKKLSTVSLTDISLHKENGEIQKNSLNYDVIWTEIPEAERPYCSGYELRIRDADGREVIYEYPLTEVAGNSGTYTATVDLDELGSQEIYLDVRAKALPITEQISYRNGLYSEQKKLKVASRMIVPDISMLIMKRKDSEAESGKETVKVSEFSGGMWLEMSNHGVYGAESAYELALALYENPQNAEGFSDVFGDSSEDEEWSAGADVVLADKTNPIRMSGNAELSEYLLKLDPDYAGKWIKAVIRQVSDSQISSKWSDEDADSENTQDYQWIQLPMVQLDTPVIHPEDAVRHYYDDTGVFSEAGNPSDMPYLQTRMSFKEVEYAQSYRIQLIRTAVEETEIWPEELREIQYVDWIYLEKAENGTYDVYYASTDQAIDWKSYTEHADGTRKHSVFTAVPEDVIVPVYIGNTGADGRVFLPYQGTVAESIGDRIINVRTVSYIQFSPDAEEKEILLQLPDVEKEMIVFAADSDLFTEKVSVKAYADKEMELHYAESEISLWNRREWGISELENYEEAPEASNLQEVAVMSSILTKPELNAYEITAKALNPAVMVVDILLEDETTIKYWYSTYVLDGVEGLDVKLLTVLLPYEQYKNLKIRSMDLTVAQLTENGLSQWAEKLYHFSELPEIDPLILNAAAEVIYMEETAETNDVFGDGMEWMQEDETIEEEILDDITNVDIMENDANTGNENMTEVPGNAVTEVVDITTVFSAE